jgi:hypothetical protein
MAAPYAWPYLVPQQQQHPYFQFPPASGSGHRPSRSWQGSPQVSPPVLPALLPIVPAPAPVAAPVYQPGFLHANYHPRSRRHSFDASYVAYQPVSPGIAPWPAVPAPYYTYSPGWSFGSLELPHPQLHNLLNGDVSSQRLHINFASVELEFRRRSGLLGGIDRLGAYDLEQPATNPQMTRVRIVCDLVPQWPVDVHVSGTTLTPHRRHRPARPYLTLEDLLFAVHASLHRKISHDDWGRLTYAQETEIARAYTRRYKASGSSSEERRQQAEGVKRIDFLLRSTWFKGFTWLEPENGVEKLKLLVGMES